MLVRPFEGLDWWLRRDLISTGKWWWDQWGSKLMIKERQCQQGRMLYAEKCWRDRWGSRLMIKERLNVNREECYSLKSVGEGPDCWLRRVLFSQTLHLLWPDCIPVFDEMEVTDQFIYSQEAEHSPKIWHSPIEAIRWPTQWPYTKSLLQNHKTNSHNYTVQ